MKKLLIFMFLFLMAASITSAADLTVEEIISNIQTNQSAIQDMSADTITKITSSIKGAPEMTQKGKILTKYPNKSRVEVFSPVHQVTITDGEKMIIINKTTGQRFENDLTEANASVAGNNGKMDFEKAKEYFSFEAKKTFDGYTITGTPREDNKLIGKMEFLVDDKSWLPKVVKVYTPDNKLISQSELFYSEISGINIMTKNISTVSMPQGQMKMEMEYANVKVNEGVGDSNFVN